MKKQIESPYKPKIKGADGQDTDNFDPTFTNEVVQDSVIPESELGKTLAGNDSFGGFTYSERPGQFM